MCQSILTHKYPMLGKQYQNGHEHFELVDSTRSVFLNASNQTIQNVRVCFDIVSPALDIYESISTGTSTVYSDASGVAIADYIAGTRTSPTNGVIIVACYGNTDADIAAGACANSK